jgi:hypothetical protein
MKKRLVGLVLSTIALAAVTALASATETNPCILAGCLSPGACMWSPERACVCVEHGSDAGCCCFYWCDPNNDGIYDQECTYCDSPQSGSSTECN